MFIRETKTKNSKTGKIYRKHTLVQSVRTDEGPRQRTVMQLGQLTIPRKSWPALAAELERRIAGQSEFGLRGIERSEAVVKAADNAMQSYGPRAELKAENVCREDQANFARVDLNCATSSNSRSVGPELLVHDAWQLFELPRLLGEIGFDAAERSLAEAVVAARMINPGSDLSSWHWIRDRSAIGELTEDNLSTIGRNRVYAIADRLCAFRERIEGHVRGRVNSLFPCEQQLFLFDLTNFYLEGQALGNSLAHHGKCKQKRNDCRLVSLALAVDARGFPLFSRIYPGNIGEPATLTDVLQDAGLLDKQPTLPMASLPTVVMDRGIATDANIKLLADNNIAYIAIERGARNKDYLEEFRHAETDPSFSRIDRGGSADIFVKKVAGEREGTVSVLCVSGGKKNKEQAMARRWEERACEDLVKLQTSIRAGNIRQREKIVRKLGRLDERYGGFGKRFAITLVAEELDDNRIVDLAYERKPVFDLPPEEINPLLGTYVIETPLGELDATRIWQLYMTLTRVEGAFRSFKTDLGTRPIYHQLAERTTAHLFVSVLAYSLLASIEYRLQATGDSRSWQTIREIMQSHRRDTLMLTDDTGTIHHIRQTGAPEPAHLEIYRKLAVTHRMPRFREVVAKRL